MREIGEYAYAVDLGREYRGNYSRLGRALTSLEAGQPAVTNDVRRALAVGTHALARTSRQLGYSPNVSAGHFRRAFQLFSTYGEHRSAFSALLGEVLSLQESDPAKSMRVLAEAESYPNRVSDEAETVRWWLRLVGVLRAQQQTDDSVSVHRKIINPRAASLDNEKSDERVIRENAWAALLLEEGRRLDEVYEVLTGTNYDDASVMHAVAVYERHVQFIRLYAASGDVALAERHVQVARSMSVENSYNPRLLIMAERKLRHEPSDR
jgi:hypothetical protein